MLPCPACGASLALPTAFCPHCGAPLAAVGGLDVTRAHEPVAGRAWSGAPAAPDGLFTPGNLLGDRYRILGLLGRGGMGEVYRADDLKLGQAVALKFLPPGLDLEQRRLDRFLGEIRTARQVSHPNVCRVYDVGEFTGRQFLTMEYVDGEDLASLLRRIGRLPHDKALEIARQVCAGLAASHERGVVHRDLKPANVMLDGRGKVRITDFGLAAVAGTGNDGELAGTPAYMAPEQLAGKPVSPQSDIYALGLLLFELFTGRRVHDVETVEELRARHDRPASNVVPEHSGDMDPAILRVIERCLEPEPARRPQHAIAVAAALPGGDPLAAALAAGETPSPQMVAAAGDESTWSPRTAAAWAAVIVLATAFAVALHGRQVYHHFVPLPHSPEVLAAKADDLLARLGHTAVDTTGGFRMRPGFLPWARANHPEQDPRPALSRLAVPMVSYWHYSSPIAIIGDTIGIIGDGPARFAATAAVPRVAPPVIGEVAGATIIELTPDGRLVRFEAAPPIHRPDASRTPAADWAEMFRWAGLDPAAFRPVESTFVAGVPADERRAWVASGSGDWVTEGLRVEAGAFAGSVAYFELVAPWTTSERADRPPSAPPAMLRMLISAFVVIILAGLALASRNLRQGRSDRRGTARLAGFTGLATFVAGVSAAHHVPHMYEVGLLGGAVAFAMYAAGITYVFYTALEPFVRRRWPQSLIGWTRLLSGGWRDPVVGRELAVGMAVGLLTASLTLATPLLVERATGEWIPQAEMISSVKWLGLSTGAPWLYALATAAAAAPFYGLFGLFILFMLRVVLRNAWLAGAAYTLLIVGMFVGGMAHPAIQAPVESIVLGLSVIVLTRHGFLAYAAMNVPLTLIGILGLSFGGEMFYGASMLAGLVMLVAPGLFGVYTALEGRWGLGNVLED